MIKTFCLSALCLILINGCQLFTIPEDADPLNELPMYGGQREPYEKKRTGASQKCVEDGWDCLYSKKEPRNAMMNFNRAWMYDPDNPKAYLGMGIIVGIEAEGIDDPAQRMEKIDRSIKLIEKAQSLDNADTSVMTSLAKAYMDKACRLNDKAEKDKYLKKSEELFITTSKLSPKGATYFNWSVCLYHQERYDEAWKMLLKANEMNYRTPPGYLSSLRNKLDKQ